MSCLTRNNRPRLAACFLFMFLWVPSLGLAHGDLGVQIAEATARIEADPDQGALYLRRGELHRLHQGWSAAESDYETARRLDPALEDEELDFLEGRFLRESGRPQAALERLRKALGRSSIPPTLLWLELGRSYGDLNRYASAVSAWRRGLALSERRSPDLYLQLADFEKRAELPWRERMHTYQSAIDDLGPIVTLVYPATRLALEHSETATARDLLFALPKMLHRTENWQRHFEALQSKTDQQPAGL